MKSKTSVLIPALAIAALAASTGIAMAQTEILTFDDLAGVGGYDQYIAVPYGYGGLQWQNFLYMDGLTQTANSGYVNGVVSPNNIVFNAVGYPAVVSDGSFNLNSAYLTAAWDDGLQVEVQGFVGAAMVYDNTYTVNTTAPTLLNFNYAGINQVTFKSSSGTPHPGLGSAGEQFVMDNLSVTLVPEPSTFALAGLAVLLLSFQCLPRWSRDCGCNES